MTDGLVRPKRPNTSRISFSSTGSSNCTSKRVPLRKSTPTRNGAPVRAMEMIIANSPSASRMPEKMK